LVAVMIEWLESKARTITPKFAVGELSIIG
jgi:hypothetical protein